MKNYLILLLLVFNFLSSFSQTINVKDGVIKEDILSLRYPVYKWYSSYGGVIHRAPQEVIEKKLIFLYPDSTVKMIYSEEGVKKEQFHGLHTIGGVVDLDDSLLYTNNSGDESKYIVNCDLDSFKINFIYGRGRDSMMVNDSMVEVIDTLYVQFFEHLELNFDTLRHTKGENKGELEVYSTPKSLNPSTLLANEEVGNHVFLLGRKDTSVMHDSGWVLSTIQKSIQVLTRGSEYSTIGYKLTFKPMLKANLGDTLFDRFANEMPKIQEGITNRLNYFAYLVYENTGKDFLAKEFYNNMFYTTKELLYGDTVNNFINYEPSIVRENRIYGAFGFYVDLCGVSNPEIESNESQLIIYPNPIQHGELLKYTITGKNNIKGRLSVIDINGTVLLDEHNITESVTSYLGTQSLKAGCYFLRFESENGGKVQRFVVY